MNSLRILGSLMLFFISFPFLVFADGFVINLYYDDTSNTLRFDNAAESVERNQSIETSIVEFSKSDLCYVVNEDGSMYDQCENNSDIDFRNQPFLDPYILKIYDENNALFSMNAFDKREGVFQVTIPYFSLAKRLAIVERETNEEILSADLTKFMTCNGNGTCGDLLGENEFTCLSDCVDTIKASQKSGTGLLLNNTHAKVAPDKSSTQEKFEKPFILQISVFFDEFLKKIGFE